MAAQAKAEIKAKDSGYSLWGLSGHEGSNLILATKESTICLYLLINTGGGLMSVFVNGLTFISMNRYCVLYRQGWCICLSMYV